MILIFGVIDTGIKLGVLDLRVFLVKFFQHVDCLIVNGYIRCALGFRHRKAQHLPPRHFGDIALFSIQIADVGYVAEFHRSASTGRNHRFTEREGAGSVPKHTHRLFGPGNFSATPRSVEIHCTKLLVDLRRGYTLGLHADRIEHDTDFAADPTRALHARHAGNSQQSFCDRVIDVPAQFLERHINRFGRVISDGATIDVDAADLWL